MKLSKQESRYRTKLMQEHHYNKQEQKAMDRAIAGAGRSYKTIYKGTRQGETYLFMAEIGANRLGRAMAAVGTSASEAAKALSRMTAALNHRESKCIMPEQPYCPSCPHGTVIYPEWCETYEDTQGCTCEWICDLKEENGK